MKLQEVWSYHAHWPVRSLERVGQQLIVPVRQTALAALDGSTGEELWRTRRQEVVPWDLATTSTHAFIRGPDSLTALSLSTGAVTWKVTVPSFSGWLHAFQDTVLIGGWRGYSPLQAYDTSSGRALWTHFIQETPVRTGIYEPANAAFVVSSDGRVLFLRLSDGQVIHNMHLPDLASEQAIDLIPRGVFGAPGAALLLRGAGDSFYRLVGPEIEAERHTLGHRPVTAVLEEQGGEVYFQGESGRFCAHDVQSGLTRTLGWAAHNAAWSLPITRMDDDAVVVGTSFGQLLLFTPEGHVVSRGSLGRRILTKLHVVNDSVVFGTQSGTVMAWRCQDLR